MESAGCPEDGEANVDSDPNQIVFLSLTVFCKM